MEQVFAWVKTYGGKIFGQMRRMGISVDWDRLAFTMDDNLVAAVQEAFVRLFQEGLIYRENRLVNWCCTLHTAVSDIEVSVVFSCFGPMSNEIILHSFRVLAKGCCAAPVEDFSCKNRQPEGTFISLLRLAFGFCALQTRHSSI